jgi:threonine synthase
MPPYTLFTALHCTACDYTGDPARLHTVCPTCRQPLEARYDLAVARAALTPADFAARPKGMWRWHELLPAGSPEAVVTLGEGDTPSLPLPRLARRLDLLDLWLKDESLNPTGTFKARGVAVAITRARELGVERVVIPTAGNAGGALAAYAARAGLAARVFLPADTPRANVEECRAVGAEVTRVDGLISDAAKQAGELAAREGWFDVSTFKEPYRLEGKKIMGYEIAESFGWRWPDVIVYPTGGGMGLAAIWKAVLELEELGWVTGRRPRLIAVQAWGCAPVIKAFALGSETCEFWEGAHTAASGLRVPKSYGDRLILRSLYDSRGAALAVSEEKIAAAQRLLGETEGIFAAPEGAANVAALFDLTEQGVIERDERVLLLNTGTGLKYLQAGE